MKKTYSVVIEEVWCRMFTVVAETEEEAIELVLNDGDGATEDGFEYDRVLDDPCVEEMDE